MSKEQNPGADPLHPAVDLMEAARIAELAKSAERANQLMQEAMAELLKHAEHRPKVETLLRSYLERHFGKPAPRSANPDLDPNYARAMKIGDELMFQNEENKGLFALLALYVELLGSGDEFPTTKQREAISLLLDRHQGRMDQRVNEATDTLYRPLRDRPPQQ